MSALQIWGICKTWTILRSIVPQDQLSGHDNTLPCIKGYLIQGSIFWILVLPPIDKLPCFFPKLAQGVIFYEKRKCSFISPEFSFLYFVLYNNSWNMHFYHSLACQQLHGEFFVKRTYEIDSGILLDPMFSRKY